MMDATITEPPARKAGAPVGNTNAIKHGCKSKALRAPVGNLPKRFRRIASDLVGMRTALENAVLRRHGEISETRALLLQSALRGEQAARACQWQLRFADQQGALDTAALTTLLRLQLDATKRRDEAIKALDLDATPADQWAGVFDVPATPVETPPTAEASSAIENAPHSATENAA